MQGYAWEWKGGNGESIPQGQKPDLWWAYETRGEASGYLSVGGLDVGGLEPIEMRAEAKTMDRAFSPR
jgi:hypothetical protein